MAIIFLLLSSLPNSLCHIRLISNFLISTDTTRSSLYIIKIKIHSSCEIEYFAETHLCKLCDTPIARITGCVSSYKDIGRRLPLQLQCTYQGQQGDVRQSVRGNYQTRF